LFKADSSGAFTQNGRGVPELRTLTRIERPFCPIETANETFAQDPDTEGTDLNPKSACRHDT
jgi:hypothetical protein